MKRLLFALLFMLSLINAKSLEQIYLEGGIIAVRDAIEANLQNKSYWEQILANMDLKYGYYDKPVFITVVDKEAKKLELFKYDNGKLVSQFKNEVITGLMGDKLKEGDLKTPVGAYDITRHFKPSDPYLGPAAFSLNYPNLYDNLRKRTGSGIWIHGYPMDGERIDPTKTRGCVAIENDRLLEYEKIVGDSGGVVLINESGIKEASMEQISVIFAQLFAWKHAWTISDTEAYLSFYDPNFTRFDGQKYDAFAAMKRSIFAKKENKFIGFTQFSISPYPGTGDGNFFKISFDEKYVTQSYKFNGRKTLYVRLDGDKMKILIEQ